MTTSPPKSANRARARRPDINRFRAQHLAVEECEIDGPLGRQVVAVNRAESPLGWLARRTGRDGRPLIEPVQFLAGERLRADFARASLMARTTANWEAAVTDGRRSDAHGHITEIVVAARQRVRHALDAVGSDFSGLLLDVCCFLKRLDDVERERGWPTRSGKVVLQLGLDRLARHYGLAPEASGPRRSRLQTWTAPDDDAGNVKGNVAGSDSDDGP